MPNELTPADLDAIAARCEKATPGPWELSKDRYGLVVAGPAEAANPKRGRKIIAEVYSRENRKLIAAARTDVPRLITALRAAWAEVERLNETAADTAIVVKARELVAMIETRWGR